VQHAKEEGRLEDLKAAGAGSVAGSRAAGDMERDFWLCPLEDRRRLGAQREGMLKGFSLGSYLLLLDYTSRLCRQGKAQVSREVASILERLGSSAEVWGSGCRNCLTKPACWAATSARIAHLCGNWPGGEAFIIWTTWRRHRPEGHWPVFGAESPAPLVSARSLGIVFTARTQAGR